MNFIKKILKDSLNLLMNISKIKKIEYKVLIVPQYYDLKFKKSHKKYINFFRKLGNPNILDITEEISKLKNWEKYYFVDKYGGHLNTQETNY